MKPLPKVSWLVGLIFLPAWGGTGAAHADQIDQATTACKTKGPVVQMDKFIASNDMRSLRKLVDQRVKVGDCTPVKARTEVKVDRRDADLACVKAKGDARCAWVLETTLRITSDPREPVRQDYIACQTPLYLDTGRKILAGNDPDAVKRFQIATTQSGQCLSLKKGEMVGVERRDDKILCVRPRGEDQCYWTDSVVLPPAKVAEDSGNAANASAAVKAVAKPGTRRTARKRQ